MLRAVRFKTPAGLVHIGRLEGDAVYDAGRARPEGFVPSRENWHRIESAQGAVLRIDQVQLLPPVVPPKLIGIGVNYRAHAEESGLEPPAKPIVFAKFTSALIGPGEPIVLPYDEPRPDYEAEVALVIGERIRRATPAQARAAIGGFTAINDVSGREAQFGPGRQFTRGKSYDTFAPLGPAIVAADGVDLSAIGLRCTVSGEVMQESSTADLIFSPEDLVVFCSAAFTLEPGDVIATGTPGGVGDGRKPPRYLRDGDTVEVWVEHVGTLTNPCVAEPAPAS